MVPPVTVLWGQKAPTLISHHPADWRATVFYQLCNVSMFPPCLCVFRCGTTLWPRQLRTGLMSACGSTGHLTSSGSWVKTSPSGQDGKWPLTSLPLLPTSAASLKDGSHSSHGCCLAAPFFFLLKSFALWPGDCLRNAPVTLQINKSCVFSHDPWGQRHIPLVGLDFPFGNTGHHHMFYTFRFLLRNSMRLKGEHFILTSRESFIVKVFSYKNN